MSRAYLVGATQVVIGASTVLTVTAGSFENGVMLKKVGTSFSIELTAGESFGIGTGYPIANREVIEISGPAQFFLACSGVTGTIAFARAYSDGASGLPNLPPVHGGIL